MNPKRILIVSEAGDLHSDAVAWALRKKGHDCECLLTPDFPTLLSLSVHLAADDRTGRFLMRGPDVTGEDQSEPFDAVWMRRPGEAVLPDDMHPGRRIQTASNGSLWSSPVTSGPRMRNRPVRSSAARCTDRLRRVGKSGVSRHSQSWPFFLKAHATASECRSPASETIRMRLGFMPVLPVGGRYGGQGSRFQGVSRKSALQVSQPAPQVRVGGGEKERLRGQGLYRDEGVMASRRDAPTSVTCEGLRIGSGGVLYGTLSSRRWTSIRLRIENLEALR